MKRFGIWLVSIVLLGVIALGIVQRQQLRDLYIAQTHQLQPKAGAVAGRLELTAEGERLYRASRTEIQAADQFNQSCAGVHREMTIVLGCYTRQRIFVFQVADERLDGAMEVTAAHELLHAVYERLPARERQRLDASLAAAAKAIPAGRLADTIALYEKSVPSQVSNELHSILGTELQQLEPELEEHYGRYFANRQKIVNLARQYSAVFVQLEQEIKGYDKQLAQLAGQKTVLEATLERQQAALGRSQNRLNQLRSQDNISTYNQMIPQHNTVVAAYNRTVGELRALIEQYNVIVERRNAVAVTQNSLVQTLDSKYELVEE